jgi:hypothetical protein
MAKARRNPDRENRIREEIIVDAYGPEEQAMGWYYYLEERWLGLLFQEGCDVLIQKLFVSRTGTRAGWMSP